MNLAMHDKPILDANLESARSYWLRRLSGGVAPSSIVQDANRAPNADPRREAVEVAGLQSTELAALTKGSPFLLFTFLTAALDVCIHRHTGDETIVLGSPAPADLGRPNAVTIVERIDRALPFRKLLSAVRETLRQAYAHDAYPISRLMRELGLKEAQGRCPLFSTVIRLDGLHGDLPELQTDLIISFALRGEDLSARLDYRCGAIGRDAVERFAKHLRHVVQAAARNLDRRVGDFQILTDEERSEILFDWNDTGCAYPDRLGVHELFERQVAQTPDAVAVREADRALSYAELNRRANQLGHALRAQGAVPDQAIGLLMDRSPAMLVAILGILKSGAAYLPLDPNWPDERVALIARDSGMRLIVTTANYAERLRGLEEPASSGVIDVDGPEIATLSGDDPALRIDPDTAAYILYTSGTTGKPKGIVVPHKGVVNYVYWAKKQYLDGERLTFPLFSPITFDLTVTSVFVPLISGGSIVVYGDDAGAPAVLSVMQDDAVDIIKLTPAHLQLLRDAGIRASRVRKLILGGEDLKTALVRSLGKIFRSDIEIFNEYGPTETVVGCMIHRYDPTTDTAGSVPIGRAIDNAGIYVLDKSLNPVPVGTMGEIYIAGDGVARGYQGQPGLTAETFISDPYRPGARMYRTGDLARWRSPRVMEYCGRTDHQVKIRGARIELGEVEAALAAHPAIRECVVDVVTHGKVVETQLTPSYCATCGLPSNYPGVRFDDEGVCNFCRAFETYRDKAKAYFRTREELERLFETAKAESTGDYDCIVLYSGGKDSSYALAQVVGMGMRVLAFTLDNGYLSEQAKDNIRRVVDTLHVDHVFGSTPFMRDIFAESLRRNSNVCNGCFKTIYTLAMNLARERGINYIVTGLSRGQLFETRLAELYENEVFDPAAIDRMVLDARKLYHRAKDVISRTLDVGLFDDDATFETIKFVDFYRYCDVELSEIYDFLKQKVPWIRPDDTGRSTNCLINEVGIFVHKKKLGYHNYALPYCWDVRMGHKTREAALAELDEHIDVANVNSILTEIGYEWDEDEDKSETALVGYYVSDKRIALEDVKRFLGRKLPAFMVPSYFIRLDAIPLTANGKVDRKALARPKGKRPDLQRDFVAPQTPVEIELARIWSSLLGIGQIGIHDNFFDLGGHSLLAARVIIRIRSAFNVELSVRHLFEVPTIAGLASAIAAAPVQQGIDGPALVRSSRQAHRQRRPNPDMPPAV